MSTYQLFGPMLGHMEILRWANMFPLHPVYIPLCEENAMPTPKKCRYSHDPVVDERIAADVAQLPRRPVPAYGEQSKKHGRHSTLAIRNARISKLVARSDP